MNNRLHTLKDILWFLAVAGAIGAMFRLWFGLGPTTNLSDAVPWGLWKVLNMIAGVALSTSGFTVGFLVYVLRLERFRPFVKPAILIAFLGYGCSCAALLFDIGLPHRFWHPIIMTNINSFLFEVFWCVMLYFTVTAIELAPTILQRFNQERLVRILHRVAFGVVVAGISFSSLHHSSLGSLFLVSPQRLHPLWYTPWLPLLFIISAMGGGLMVVVLAKILWSYWYDRESVFGAAGSTCQPLIDVKNGKTTGLFAAIPRGPHLTLVRSLATIAAAVLGVYIVLKFVDLGVNGGWSDLISGSWQSWLFLVEVALTAIIPIVLMILPAVRRSPAGIGVAAASAAIGVAVNRLDVGIIGYFHTTTNYYFPSLLEWVVATGVVAAAGLAFVYISERFAIFSESSLTPHVITGLFNRPQRSVRQLWHTVWTDSLHRVSLVAVFSAAVAWILLYPPYWDAPDTDLIRASRGLDNERTKLLIDGNRTGVQTTFAHAEHQKRLGDTASCGHCHHVSMPNDRSTSCAACHRRMNEPTDIFRHQDHIRLVAHKENLGGLHPENRSCKVCHIEGEPESARTAQNCLECHRSDMYIVAAPEGNPDLKTALSFRDAMHQTCVSCHEKEAVKVNRPGLAQCETCHASLRRTPPGQHEVAGL